MACRADSLTAENLEVMQGLERRVVELEADLEVRIAQFQSNRCFYSLNVMSVRLFSSRFH